MTDSKTKNNLNILRVSNKLSQRQLAKELSVTQGMISGWETGRYAISSEDAIRIASYFNVTTDYLLGKTGFLEGQINEGKRNIDRGLPPNMTIDLENGKIDEALILALAAKSNGTPGDPQLVKELIEKFAKISNKHQEFVMEILRSLPEQKE